MRMQLPERLWPGRLAPLGAQLVDGGIHFSLWSEHATRVELCVFDADGARELRRYAMHADDDGVWNGLLPGLGAGLVYGYRVHGPYQPDQGLRFNPNKLLLDPWARELVGQFNWSDLHHGYVQGHPDGSRSFDARDNGVTALKARVVEPLAPLTEARPAIASADVVLYELHVKGFSMQLPGIPPELRGSYAALGHPAAIAHFRQLGITSLALLPLQQSLSEAALVRRGLVNYWGYNTIGFFAADERFRAANCSAELGARRSAREELRDAVEALHAAGFEVILDVVYNHTAEGDDLGPTISFRGLDNASWYRLPADDRAHYENWSGCGNTLNLNHPRVTQFVLDSLRYWASEIGVDGFRFDLASVLGRRAHSFDANAPFLVALRQDPLLSGLRLIAEPWDCGPQGYQVGRFPGRFLEWNDRFRDSVRRYWLGRGVTSGEFARRFCGSADLFHHGLRRPTASVNFVSAHDGRTLADVVSYGVKHNQANGEDNRDGRNDEPAEHFGIEGYTTDPLIQDQRRRVRHAMLATTCLAQGTPMLLAGDEHANSQRGNNNAYCQDNPLGWLDWGDDREAAAVISLALALRRSQPLLRHPHWFADILDTQQARVRWLTPAGTEMAVHDWHDSHPTAFGVEMYAAKAEAAHLCLLFNPAPSEREFDLPGEGWCLCLDSSGERAPASTLQSGGPIPIFISNLLVPAHALLVLARIDIPEASE